MRIAVDIKLLPGSIKGGLNNFIYESLQIITAQHPEHDFILICDTEYDRSGFLSKNITFINTRSLENSFLLLRVWYHYKLAAILKKNKADFFIAANGICSLNSEVPQLLVIQQVFLTDFPQPFLKKKINFYKKFIPLFIQKSKRIVVSSATNKKEVTNRYLSVAIKIDVVYSGTNELYKPVDEQEKDLIKDKYTEGKEFFLCQMEIFTDKDLLILLKAFSIFKKKQKSNMQLVITAKDSMSGKLQKNLRLYKYTSDVKILFTLSGEENAKITAASYTFISFKQPRDFPVTILQAMQCNIPVIAMRTEVSGEICGEAILYTEPDNFENLADKMMTLFKDENKRNDLIRKGNLQALQYSWNRTANLLWQSVLKVTAT